MTVQELAQQIIEIAQDGLGGQTWEIADILANQREALENILKLCQEHVETREKR